MAFAQRVRPLRPIEGAVATLGVSDRVTFLRKTYAHLGVSLIAFAALTGALFKFAPQFTWKLANVFSGSTAGVIGVFIVFMLVMFGAQRLAISQTSRGLQYLGLALGILCYTFLLIPLIWILQFQFGNYTPEQILLMRHGIMQTALNGTALAILLEAVVITITIFVGLTLVVFVTKKDFSFLRGMLMIGTFAVLGIGLAAALFGFSLGALFCGFVIVLMAGYILYETSFIMKSFPPTMYVAAALMLFTTVATLFMYVLDLLMSLQRD